MENEELENKEPLIANYIELKKRQPVEYKKVDYEKKSESDKKPKIEDKEPKTLFGKLLKNYRVASTKKLAGEQNPIIDKVDFLIDIVVPALTSKAAGNVAKNVNKKLNTYKELKDPNLYNDMIQKSIDAKHEGIKNDPIIAEPISPEAKGSIVRNDDYELYRTRPAKDFEGEKYGKVVKGGNSFSWDFNKPFDKEYNNVGATTHPLVNTYLNNAKVAEKIAQWGPVAQQALDDLIINAEDNVALANGLKYYLPRVSGASEIIKLKDNYEKNIKKIDNYKSKGEVDKLDKWMPERKEIAALPPTISQLLDVTNVKYDKKTAYELADKIFYDYLVDDNFSPLKYEQLEKVHNKMNEDNAVKSLKEMIYWLNRMTERDFYMKYGRA